MAYPDYIRAKAIQMRIEGDLTIDEIAERLALPRTRTLTDRKLSFSIQYHADQDLDELREFWGESSASTARASGCTGSRTATIIRALLAL